jgi:replicative DNA helicase
VDLARLRKGDTQPRDEERLAKAADALELLPILYHTKKDISVLEIRGISTKIKRDQGLSCIIVDYLQIMQRPGKENPNIEISFITRQLKILAGELGIPVILLSQLSREVEKRPNKRPVLSDLRDSGSIEQDADLVLFLYRDEYYNPKTEKIGVAEVIVGKQRNGATNTVELAFNGQHVRFSNVLTR